MPMARRPGWWVVAAAAAFGFVVAVLASNFIGGEKKIDQKVQRLYALADPRFVQELGVLLGPTFLPGNSVQVLVNGEQIFPPMLAAIRARV